MTLLYSAVSFLSALLLFMIQPTAAKSALPILGGAPFVWNGCMLFFQALLLAGYLYAHGMNRFLPTRQQVFVHIPLLVIALFYFPSAFMGGDAINPSFEPMRWLLVMLAVSVGIPFFVMSATAPLIQRWFATASPRHADNPYFLYAASNLGSFGALLAYPFIIEPNLNIADQLDWMHGGFALLVFLFITVGINLSMKPAAANIPMASAATADAVPVSRILRWLLLSAVPSSLLYGVTAHITTDVASFPLFWVIPLALYLLTFVLVFARKPIGVRLCQNIHIPLVSAFLLFSILYNGSGWWPMLAHLTLFFAVAMSCHGHLADCRPHASRLTQFYLWLSLGGVLGGTFNIFVAPNLFTSIVEYPLALILSMAAVVPYAAYRQLRWQQVAFPLLTVGALYGVCVLALSHNSDLISIFAARESVLGHTAKIDNAIWMTLIIAINISIVAVVYLYERKKLVVSVVTAAAIYCGYFISTGYLAQSVQHKSYTERNIFGVNRVFWEEARQAFIFQHGTTTHGVQSTDPALRLKPVSYYGPLIQVFQNLDSKTARLPFAVLGLGVGTVACYGKPGQTVDFYEIDPAVEKIARNESFFTYMRDCPPKKNVYLEDARIGVSKMPEKHYGLIVADAFTSDAIPIHLLTLEAAAIYLNKVADDGVVAYDISNRHIDMAPVLATIAHRLGAKAYLLNYIPKTDHGLEYSSIWLVMTKNDKFAKSLLAKHPDWKELPTAGDAYLWRDDYSNIVKVMKW